MAGSIKDEEPRYGIGAVSKITGLSDHTIRVWERRYGAVVAERAANGRRLFAEDDIEKLSLLKALTDRGIAISRIAGESISALRERIDDLHGLVTSPVGERLRIAVFGDYLASQVSAWAADLEPLEVLLADDNRDRFSADLERQRVDVVIYESAILDGDTLEEIGHLLDSTSAKKAVVVYTFGRSEDARAAVDAGHILLRAPVGPEEIRTALLRVSLPPGIGRAGKTDARPPDHSVGRDSSGPIPPRQFSSRQLSALETTAPQIDCECPRHLSRLVTDLSAFEIYSARCSSRNEEDAALHRYLHRTTAQARSMVEAALQRVIEVEGLDCDV
jgi:DNA-binding NarL/FixJ family response regulator